MNRINVNGQNGVATSAVVNVKVWACGNRVTNEFKSAEEISEIRKFISLAINIAKKDFYINYEIGDFVGHFSIVKDMGSYFLCCGDKFVDLHFNKLIGKNIDTLERKIYHAISEMVAKCEQKIAKEIASEKNEIIESMVENETSFNTHIFNSFGLFEYLFPNQNNWGGYHWVEHYVEKYYTECMKKKLVKKYNLNYDLDSYDLTLLFRDYMDMLEKKWDFENALLEFENVVENAPKNDAPILDNDIDRVVNTIKSYLANYTPSYLDKFGDCVITIGWEEFSENDMQMLIEDDVFEGLVIDSLVGEIISDMLVYDDGVYVTVDYDKMFNKVA